MEEKVSSLNFDASYDELINLNQVLHGLEPICRYLSSQGAVLTEAVEEYHYPVPSLLRATLFGLQERERELRRPVLAAAFQGVHGFVPDLQALILTYSLTGSITQMLTAFQIGPLNANRSRGSLLSDVIMYEKSDGIVVAIIPEPKRTVSPDRGTPL